MNGKELFLQAMSYSKNLSNNIENENDSEWKDWDYNFQNNLETTVSSSESSESSSNKVIPMKYYSDKDFGTLNVLADYPYGEEYKKQIENARFLSKKKCFIYKQLNAAQRKDICVFAKNNKMRYNTYGKGNDIFIAIWGAMED